MTRTVQGVIHGRTIELSEDLGIAEGQVVVVRVTAAPTAASWEERVRKSAGALAPFWTDEDDRILESIYQDRKNDTRREIEE